MNKRNETHRCLSIFPASRYFRSIRRRTLWRLIHMTFVGILASLLPFLLPVPVCLPNRLAASKSRVRDRECPTTGLRMICPSLINFRILALELALPISFCSAGSSQTFLLPTPMTEAASRFCVRRLTILMKKKGRKREKIISPLCFSSISGRVPYLCAPPADSPLFFSVPLLHSSVIVECSCLAHFDITTTLTLKTLDEVDSVDQKTKRKLALSGFANRLRLQRAKKN